MEELTIEVRLFLYLPHLVTMWLHAEPRVAMLLTLVNYRKLRLRVRIERLPEED
jgi:hypothetical protein